MRLIAIALTSSLCLLTLFSACSKEETGQTAPAKPAAIQSAEKAAASANLSTAEKTYADSCASCHDTGVLHAPKIGDKTAWAGHIEHGLEHMVSNAISGIGKMPPKGGNLQLSDAEVRAAVQYMVNKSR